MYSDHYTRLRKRWLTASAEARIDGLADRLSLDLCVGSASNHHQPSTRLFSFLRVPCCVLFISSVSVCLLVGIQCKMMAAEGSRPTPTRQFSSLQYPVPGSSSSTSAQADSSGASALNSTNNPRRTSWGRSPYSQEPPPVEPSPGSLDEFRQHCSSFYYEGDDAAGKHVEQTLRQVPHLQRKTYTTIQAATRAQFHVDTAHAKRHALEDVLRRALPGNDIGSDLGLGRASPIRDWRSPAARQARYCELRTFVNDHALKYVHSVFFCSHTG